MFGIPLEFFIFALTLAGVALLHHHTLKVALTGLSATIAYKVFYSGFLHGPGLEGLGAHFHHEWVTLANLTLLLLGFAILASQFELSRIPDEMPRLLPDNWTGGVVLLFLCFVLSTFLDNIAAAIIGGVIARKVYRDDVSTGYLAAIVAASNAGGAGSVIGDTTTTMMWIAGVSPVHVLEAFIGAGVSFAVFAVFAAVAQQKHAPIQKHVDVGAPPVDWMRALVVVFILITLMATNIVSNGWFVEWLEVAPWLGLGLWFAIFWTGLIRKPDWSVLPGALKGAIFLVSLVATASMMPVEKLPLASWQTALGLGFLSSVFDNIPLTALALKQGGYDWAILAFAVGFGGSMIWFGSSAGVALTGLFPQGRSVFTWIRQGWFVPLGYVIGFFVMLAIIGWHPTHTRAERSEAEAAEAATSADPTAPDRFWADTRRLVDEGIDAVR